MADIDLVVSPRSIKSAMGALAAAQYSYTPSSRYGRPFKCEWIPPGAPRYLRSLELTHVDNPYTIDLHSSLDRNFFGVRTVNFDALTAGGNRHWRQIHQAAQVLHQPLLLAFLAAHAAYEFRHLPLVRLVELVLVIRADRAASRLEWEDLSSMLERVGAERFVYPAFALAERLAPGSVDRDFLKRLTRAATPGMRRVLERLRPSTAQQPVEVSLGERFMWASGPIEHLRRAVHLVWPPEVAGSWRRLFNRYRDRFNRVRHGRVSK